MTTIQLTKGGIVKTFKLEGRRCLITMEVAGRWVSNPTIEMMYADGWAEWFEPEPTPEELLERAKTEKIMAVEDYDRSITNFIIGGRQMWILPADRANYFNTLQGAQRLGVESVPFLGMTIPVASGIAMLDAINLYAMQTLGVTDAHKAAVMALDTIEAVEAYDNTVGYPPMLNFDTAAL